MPDLEGCDPHNAARAAAGAERIDARGTPRRLSLADLDDGGPAVRAAMATVAGTWQLLTLTALGCGTLRYAELKRAVAGISDRMLSQTLRRCTEDGLVVRHDRRTVPPHVDYELTPLGEELVAAISEFVYTVMRLAPDVAAARQRHRRRPRR